MKGAHYEIERQFLIQFPGSALEAMFSGRHEVKHKNGLTLIDRNPVSFGYLLRFLENSNFRPNAITEQLKLENELVYWDLPFKEFDSKIVKERSKLDFLEID